MKGGWDMGDFRERFRQIEECLNQILNCQKVYFDGLIPSRLSSIKGVYLIAHKENNEVLYVGKTTNQKIRIYTNHLQGNHTTARLKKYLVEDVSMPTIQTYDQAKTWIKENCYFQFLEINDARLRGLLEGGFAYFLDSRYIEN